MLAIPVRLAIWIMIEVAFNVYPATPWSSGLLQVAHIVLLVALYVSPAPLCDENLWIDEHVQVGGRTNMRATRTNKTDRKAKVK